MHLKNYCFAEYCLSAILKICAYKKYKIINVLIFFLDRLVLFFTLLGSKDVFECEYIPKKLAV